MGSVLVGGRSATRERLVRWIALLLVVVLTLPVMSAGSGTGSLGLGVVADRVAGAARSVSSVADRGVSLAVGAARGLVGADGGGSGRRVAGRVAGAGGALGLVGVVARTVASGASQGASGASAINPGAVSTLAGSGNNATVNGTGTAASFTTLGGVVVDGATAYVGTSGSIRAVNTSSAVTSTLAGVGTGCSDSPARFNQIRDMALDASYVYASSDPCSGSSERITKTSRATGATTTIYPNASSIGAPVTVSGGGLFLVSGTSLVRYDLASGVMSTRWSYGTSIGALTSLGGDLFVRTTSGIDRLTDAGSSAPVQVSTLTANELVATSDYVYAANGPRLYRVARSDGSVKAIAGTGAAGYADGTGTDAWFAGIEGLGSDGTDLFVADGDNYRLRRVTAGSALPAAQAASATRTVRINPAAMATLAGSGGTTTVNGVGAAAGFSTMAGMTIIGNVGYVATAGAVRKVDLASGAVTTVIGGTSVASCYADRSSAAGATVAQGGPATTDGHYIYFVDNCFGAAAIRRLLPSTGAVSTVAQFSSGTSNNVPGVTFGADGNLYASVFMYQVSVSIAKIDPVSGNATTSWVTDGTNKFLGLTSDQDGLWAYQVPGAGGSRWISFVSYAGTRTPGPALPAAAASAYGGLESAGKYLYAGGNLQVIRYVKNQAGTSSFAAIGGNGTNGYADGVGAAARVSTTTQVASDGTNVYVLDDGNRRIRLLTPGQYPHDGMPNPGKCDCNNRAHGAPVDVQSGNFYHSFTDLGIPGRSGGIGVQRTYSATAASTSGMFGYGWSSTYSMRLKDGPYSTGTGPTKQVVQENSTVARFSWNGSAWVSPTDQFATLVQNGDGTWTFTRRARDRFVFNASGYLIKIVALEGFAGSPSPTVTANYTTTLSYVYGVLLWVTDPAGRSLTFGYNANLKVASVTDPTGRHVDYTYNTAGELTDVTDVAGGNWHFTYATDGTHLLVTMRDPRAKTIATNVYDNDGRVTSQTDALSRQTTFDYTSIANSVKVTDPKNNATLYTYDTAGQLVSETHGYGTADAATWTFAYSASMGGLTQVTDPNNHVETNTFDAAGNRLTHTDAKNHTTTWTYDAYNNVLTETDPLSVTTTFFYATFGDLFAVSRPLVGSSPAQNQLTVYWPTDADHPGDVTLITDPSGHNTAMTYDTNTGDLLSVTDPSGDQTTYTYDSLGRRATMVTPNGNVSGGTPSHYTTTYTVNAFGDVLTNTDPLGHTVTNTYDPDRNLKTVTDAKNHTTTNTYDDMSQLTSIARPDSTTLGNDYWPDGTLKSQTDANSKTTNYTYDAQARLKTMVDPLGRTTTYGYDSAGNLTTIVPHQEFRLRS